MFSIEPYRDASICTVPAIFAYSYSDTLIKARHSEVLMRYYKGENRAHIFKGDHNCIRDQEFYNAIINFIS